MCIKREARELFVAISIMTLPTETAMPLFQVGITPDFDADAKGRFEAVVDARLSGIPALEYGPMPDQPGKLATPEALNRFDALFALGLGIQGKVLGSVGCGNIARELFRIAKSLGFARFLAYDPYADTAAAEALGIELVTLDEVLRDSDYVTVNTLLNESTRNMIGER